MESITHRKAALRSASPASASTADQNPNKSLTDTQTPIRGQFLYGDLFLTALLPPSLVMLAFGGRPMLISICFGSMFTYIFDIFGAMETTVLSIVVTIMCLWGTLLYAARLLLQDSILNFGIVFLLSILLLLIFLALAGQFRALRLEFESSFYFIEAILMATIPLVSSTILTWFIAVEFPSLDLSFAFTVCYFLYCQLLLSPRPSSHPYAKNSSITHWGGGPYVLSVPMVVAVYLTPIILCPALHLTMHHTVVMSSSLHKFFHFGLSCLFPILTTVLSAERQLQYWPEAERPILSSLLFLFKIIVTLGLTLCLQTNELLEDLKDFSGLQEPYASLVFLLIVVLLLGAFVLQWLIPPPGDLTSNSSRNFVISGLLDACIAAAVILAAGLLGILDPRKSDAVFIVVVTLLGSGCLTEIYRGDVAHVPTTMTVLKNAFCLIVASAMVAGGLYLFTLQHLQHLDLIIFWQGVDWKIQTLCSISCLFAAISIIAPVLLRRPRSKETGFLGYVPGETHGVPLIQSLSSTVGSYLLIAFSAGTAAFEMMIRDQDWSAVISSSESYASSASVVYPSFLFVTTSLLLCMTATHLYTVEALGYSFSFVLPLRLITHLRCSAPPVAVILIIQLCKLLHLLGVNSSLCFSAAFLLISLTLPFVIHISSGWISSRIADSSHPDSLSTLIWSPTLSVLEAIYYPLGAAVACYLSSIELLPLLLTIFGDHHSTVNQCAYLAAALWFFFTAFFALVYWRSAALLRSILFLLGGFCCLMASNSLGQLSFRYDPSQPIPFSFELLTNGDPSSSTGSHIFYILSLLLAFSAFAGLLPVRSLIPRLLFVVVFTFFSAKALEQVAFPLVTSEEVVTVDGGMFALPWLSCITLCFLGTSTVLNASTSSAAMGAQGSGQWVMALFVASPVVFFIWILIEESFHLLAPLSLACCLVNGVVAFCSRMIEFARQHDPVYLSNSSTKVASSSTSSTVPVTPFAESVCVICSCVAFISGIFTCWLSRHLVLFDFAIPLLSLIFYTTGDGTLIQATPALGISASLSSLWWILSALFSLFLKGHDGLQFLNQFSSGGGSSSSFFLFEDVNVSIWNDNDEIFFSWVTFLHLGLLFLTLPGVILSFLRRRQESEDLMFILAAVSLLSAIISQIWSLRLLGLTSAVYSAWRCYDIGHNTRRSDQTI